MPRIFVAIPLPAAVAAELADMVPAVPGLRRVAPELLHLTLAFVGQIAEERVAEVVAATASAARACAPFDVPLDALGRFPAHGKPTVLWVSAGAAGPSIERLGEAVRTELGRRRVPFDAKPLRAHVTLARVREGTSGEEARATIAAVRGARVGPLAFRAAEVQVMESRLGPKGPRYSSRARLTLEGAVR